MLLIRRAGENYMNTATITRTIDAATRNLASPLSPSCPAKIAEPNEPNPASANKTLATINIIRSLIRLRLTHRGTRRR